MHGALLQTLVSVGLAPVQSPSFVVFVPVSSRSHDTTRVWAPSPHVLLQADHGLADHA